MIPVSMIEGKEKAGQEKEGKNQMNASSGGGQQVSGGRKGTTCGVAIGIVEQDEHGVDVIKRRWFTVTCAMKKSRTAGQ